MLVLQLEKVLELTIGFIQMPKKKKKERNKNEISFFKSHPTIVKNYDTTKNTQE